MSQYYDIVVFQDKYYWNISTRLIVISFPDCILYYYTSLRSLINLRAQHDVNTGIHSPVAVKKYFNFTLFPLLNMLLITSKFNHKGKIYFCSPPVKHSNQTIKIQNASKRMTK